MVLFVVNNGKTLDRRKTTAALIRAQLQRSPVMVVDCARLWMDDAGLWADAQEARWGSRGLELDVPRTVALLRFERVVVRANPTTLRNVNTWHHALHILHHAEVVGLQVVNPTCALARFATKHGLLLLPPSLRVPTTIAADLPAARLAIERVGRVVLKPALGSRGHGVFVVQPTDTNLNATLELLLQRGPVVIQPYIEEAPKGDIRVLLVGGAPLVVDGVLGALHRRPARGEFRSNVHLGGTPTPIAATEALHQLAVEAGRALAKRGASFVGIDCVGGRIVEVNVCAPGGLPELEQHYGLPFIEATLDRLTAFDSVPHRESTP